MYKNGCELKSMQSFSTHGKRLAKYTSKFFGKYSRISFLEQKILFLL